MDRNPLYTNHDYLQYFRPLPTIQRNQFKKAGKWFVIFLSIIHLFKSINLIFLSFFSSSSYLPRIELNVFEGIFNNSIFLIVMVFTVSVQVLIVQFGGEFASTHALSSGQWVGCLLIAALTIPIGNSLSFLPSYIYIYLNL